MPSSDASVSRYCVWRGELVPVPEFERVAACEPRRHRAWAIAQPASEDLALLVVIEALLETVGLLERRGEILNDDAHTIGRDVVFRRDLDGSLEQQFGFVPPSLRPQNARARVKRVRKGVVQASHLSELQGSLGIREGLIEVAVKEQLFTEGRRYQR